MKRKVQRITSPEWVAVIVIALLGCHADSVSLDVGAGPHGDRFDSIRRRLAITILPGPTGETGWGDCTSSECMPDAFGDLVAEHCRWVTATSTRAQGTGDDCATRVLNAELHVCAAQELIRTIDAPSTSELVIEPPDHTVLVPPQDAESNSELARLALDQAQLALRTVGDAFHGTRVPACTDALLESPAGTGDLSSLSLVEELAHFYAEALDLARTAADRMAETGAAVSDAAYSRRADNAEASADALAPFASRTAAAHMLVGGELGLPAIAGVAEEGFFTRSHPSADAQRAMQLIRTAAIDPNLIKSTNDIPIDDLVVGTGTVAADDSIRIRIGRLQGRATLLEPLTQEATYSRLGVTRAGFIEARDYLREELRAFDRSREAVLEPVTLLDGSTTADHGMVLYAATRNPPQRLHSSYWSAVLRYDPTPNPPISTSIGWATSSDPAGRLPPGDTWGNEIATMTAVPTVLPAPSAERPAGRTVISVIDEGYRRIPQILDRLCPSSGACPSSGSPNPFEKARAIFVRTATDGSPAPLLDRTGNATVPDARYNNAAYIGRARACVYVEDDDPTDLQVLLQVAGLTGITFDSTTEQTADLLILQGRDGLACAVDGQLEGVPCTAAQLAAHIPAIDYPWYQDAGSVPPGTLTAGVTARVADRPAADTISLFVVRRRHGSTADDAAPLPGPLWRLARL